MRKRYIIANWKANKTLVEAEEWLQTFSSLQKNATMRDEEIILCPPFHALLLAQTYINHNNLPISLGSQDVSPYEVGPYTGEIPASLLKRLVKYSLIGHSERRAINDTDEIISQKITHALKQGIIPLLCVQDAKTQIPQGVTIVAYEPVSAIGTGYPDTPENAQMVAETIKSKSKIESVLYGGSVTKDNVHAFTENLDGVLVGGASLDASHFFQILQNA